MLEDLAGKRTETDTDRKNAQKVMINITIVKFAQITEGTKSAFFNCRGDSNSGFSNNEDDSENCPDPMPFN